MSRRINQTVAAFGIFILLLSLGSNKVQAYPNRSVSLQVFYDELSYYGDWINNPDYGYVWRPDVGSDFRPYYTNGRWAMTEYGNTWVSDYEWGWAPFHYGRWFYDDYDGWIWTPDTEWGPAWVDWRTGGGYYGWAPLGPRINININIGRRYNTPHNHWVFIPQRCIYYPSYSRYWEPRRNVYIYNNTTIINNVYVNRNVRYNSGPRADDIRRATRQRVPVYRIADDSRPGSTRVEKDAISIYRPDVRKDDRSSAPKSIASSSSRPTRSSDNSIDRNGSGSVSQRTQRPDASGNTGSSRPSGNSTDRGIDNRSQRPNASGNTGSSRPSGNSTDRGIDNRSQRPDARGNTGSSRPSGSATDSRSQRPDVRTQPDGNNQPSRTSESRSQRPDVSNGQPSGRSDRSDVPARTEQRPTSQGRADQSRSSAPQRQETRPETSSRPERSQPAPSRSVESQRSEPAKSESGNSRSGSTSESRPSRPSNRGN
jgi:hypothetical protein